MTTAPGSTEIMPRKTIEQLVAQRDRALELYGQAHDAMSAATAAQNAAHKAKHAASHGVTRYNMHLKTTAERERFEPQPLIDRSEYMAAARKAIDTDCWAWLIDMTDLVTLMDKKAKDQFNSDLLANPPEITCDNVFATLETFALQAGDIFKRGIAECFSKLDRRFRSHDGWKIGSRIILTYVFSESGGWNYNRAHDDTIRDVERVFRILDGQSARVSTAVHSLSESRGSGHGARQSVTETDYFRVRGFMNGNAHLWFTRDDLLDKVNALLGEFYGAPIPEDREPDKATGLYDPKTLPAKRFGFFPTPDAAAEKVSNAAQLLREAEKDRLEILEPSAGTGNLARRCFTSAREDWMRRGDYRFDNVVDCVELQPHLAAALKGMRKFRSVYCCDFLSLLPKTTGLYDRVVMNPPFDRERDIDHVMHALKFLKPDGLLVAIMSAGTEFRETKKSIAFRAFIEKMQGRFEDLPPGSFSESGTNCNTLILRVWNDARRQYR